MMKSCGRIIGLAAIIIACAAPFLHAAGEAPVTLDSLKSSYETELKKIQADNSAEMQVKIYEKLLLKHMATYQKAGNLDGVLALQKEKDRLDKEKTVFDGSADSEALAKLVQEHQKEWQQVDLDKSKKIIALAEGWYIANLETLKKQLTQQGKIEEAIQIKNEVDRIRGSAEVTAAQFTLADNGVEIGATVPVVSSGDTGKSAPVPAVAKQTIKATRKISPRGSYEGDWVSTTLTVKKGDEVSIKSSGKWKCGGRDTECGPEGYPDSRPRYIVKQSGQTMSVSSSVDRKRTSIGNYGALVYKIGAAGSVKVAGSSDVFISEEEGNIFLDANVAAGRDVRKGSKGELTVEIEVRRVLDRQP